jgi:hypothetical protein
VKKTKLCHKQPADKLSPIETVRAIAQEQLQQQIAEGLIIRLLRLNDQNFSVAIANSLS